MFYSTKTQGISTIKMAYVGMLTAIAFIVQLIELKVPIFPDFLSFDFSDIPALVGALIFGIEVGVLIELLKNILHGLLKGTSTFGVGELANFIVGVSYIVPMTMMVRKIQGLKGFLLGVVTSTISMVVVACLCNYVFLLPFYAKLYGVEVSFFVDMGTKINANIHTLWDFILLSIAPFNAIKALYISLIGILLYLPLMRVIVDKSETAVGKTV